MKRFELYLGDCLEVMATLPDGCADAIICDPPFGTTQCRWDSVIPLAPMWEQLKRIAKPRAAIVLFGSEPFSSMLRCSNLDWFKYDWVWDKAQSGNCGLAKYQPLKITENISVFSRESHRYYPQMTTGKMRKKGGNRKSNPIATGMKPNYFTMSDQYYPLNVLYFPNCANKHEREHPTQKPVALMEYLIKTYTNEDETVLDFTCGSGSTGVAALKTGRRFIGIEREPGYFKIAQRRIEEVVNPAQLAMVV